MNREEEIEQTLELLRKAHREPIAEAHFAAVRARVLAQLEIKPQPWRIPVWAYGFAVAVVVGATLFVARTPRLANVPLDPLSRPTRIAGAGDGLESGIRPAVRTTVRPTVASEQTPRRIRRRRAAAARVAWRVIGPPNPQPLIVKLVTNDPNVVIYWFSGE